MPSRRLDFAAIVGSPDYFKRYPVPRHPSDLVHHNCVRFRFSGSGAIYKWEFEVDGRPVEYEVSGNLTISDSLFPVELRWKGSHWRPHSSNSRFPIRAKKLSAC